MTRVPRKSNFQTLHARRKKRGGGFRRLFFLILVAGVICFFWRREHLPKNKVVRAPVVTTVPAKSQPKPIVVARQSPADFPRPVIDILEAQVALARRGISPGSIDAALGSQTRAAISVFQQNE